MRRAGRQAKHDRRAAESGRAIQRSVQPVAAGAAMVVLIFALTSGPSYQSRWPLSVTAGVIGLGLVAGRLALLIDRPTLQRAAYNVAAVSAMVIAVYGASGDLYFSPRWPLAVTVVLLGIGLAAGPLAQVLSRQPLHRSAVTVAAVAALIVLLYALMHGTYFQSRWPLSVPAAALGVALVIGWLAELAGGLPVARSAATVGAVAGLAVLVYGLSTDHYFSPRWALSLSAALLGLGLAAGSLAQFVSRSSETMLTERVDELSRTRRGALDVQATELRRIERDLHDGAQVRLVALSMKLGRAEDRYRDDAETAALLREAREDAAAAIRELRELARGIAPPVLTDRGLEAAVRSLAQRSGSEVSVNARLTRRLMPAVETAAYFVIAESLTNAAKHAPEARVEVSLDERRGDLFIEVTDFGPGGADPAGSGLTGLRQRAEALDGTLHVTSPAGVGTQVEAVLPCGR